MPGTLTLRVPSEMQAQLEPFMNEPLALQLVFEVLGIFARLKRLHDLPDDVAAKLALAIGGVFAWSLSNVDRVIDDYIRDLVPDRGGN